MEENDDFDFDAFEKERNKMDIEWERTEYDGKRDILKYFDRIHDNLFSYNNLLIGAFFALGQLQHNISKWTVIIPILNLWILIMVEYRMMEKSRFEASIMSQPFDDIKNKQGKQIGTTTLTSLFAIFTTFLVTLSFLYYLLK